MIEGVEGLHAEHDVSDRIVAGTLAIATAMTRGDVLLEQFPWDHLLALIDQLNEIGVRIEQPTRPTRTLHRPGHRPGPFKPVLFTQPYPATPRTSRPG